MKRLFWIGVLFACVGVPRASLAVTLSGPFPNDPTGLLLSDRDPTVECYHDRFPLGNIANGTAGELNWSGLTIGSAPAFSRPAAAANHPGVLSFVTNSGATAGQGGALVLSSAATPMLPGFATTTTWYMRWIAKLSATTDIRARLGSASDTATGPPLTGVWVRYDTNVAYGDTAFFLECSTSGTPSSITTGVAADTNFHTFVLTPTAAGTIGLSVDGAAAVMVSSNCPAVALTPMAQILTDATAQKGVDVDDFLLCVWGLGR